jgi:hypothetical protein
MSELSRRMNVSVIAISNVVRRGEKIAKELNISLLNFKTGGPLTPRLMEKSFRL